jgi:hypothetical protein
LLAFLSSEAVASTICDVQKEWVKHLISLERYHSFETDPNGVEETWFDVRYGLRVERINGAGSGYLAKFNLIEKKVNTYFFGNCSFFETESLIEPFEFSTTYVKLNKFLDRTIQCTYRNGKTFLIFEEKSQKKKIEIDVKTGDRKTTYGAKYIRETILEMKGPSEFIVSVGDKGKASTWTEHIRILLDEEKIEIDPCRTKERK